jgi:hypothetical protein
VSKCGYPIAEKRVEKELDKLNSAKRASFVSYETIRDSSAIPIDRASARAGKCWRLFVSLNCQAIVADLM